MRISYNWLKEFVALDKPPQETAQLLTMMGFETTILSSSGCFTGVVTAKVLEANKHPNADKLKLCSVSDGTNTYSVVCGAANVASGQIIPLARIGAELPGGFVIKKAKLRGVESEGMICSEKELGMAAESAGIMVLPESTPVGKPLQEVLGDSDTIMEVELPTNRPDCLSHWGIARELGAKLKLAVNIPPVHSKETGTGINISVQEPALCTRYIGCLITGVKVGPSPEWLVKKLEKCGLRPINNIVDITNYVLMELGHPLHAFDLDKMAGKAVIVRRAKEGEKIRALDNKEYSLKDSMLVIADSEKPQAIAGIIGGELSGVTDGTKNIILESALFFPPSIRRASRALNVSTDSSYRFERGTAWEVAEIASWRALSLIEELAGGKLEARKDDADKIYVPPHIVVRPERVKHVLDIEFSREEIISSLSHLGLRVHPVRDHGHAADKDGSITSASNGKDSTRPQYPVAFSNGVKDTGAEIKASIPSWRQDITQEIDLIEELARMKGYEHIPVTTLPVLPDASRGKENEPVEFVLRKKLAGIGFCEALNYSFTEEKNLNFFNLTSAHKIANPISKENEVLQPSLLPGLWKNLVLNTSQGYNDIKLFETGIVFTPQGEKKALGIIAYGDALPQWWGWKNPAMPLRFGFYFMSGLINNILSGSQYRIVENKKPSSFYHPGKVAAIEMRGKTVGEFGVLKPEYSAELQGEAVYAELDLRLLEEAWNRNAPRYESVKRFPPVKRDLSLVADKTVPFDKIYSVVASSTGKDENVAVDFFVSDIYEDAKKVGEGKKSYTIRLTFRPAGRTLTDKEANEYVEKIVTGLKDKLNITLRA